ncbi:MULTISPECIES: FadR/GntR family transcriptional regulator [Salinivibrio]|uniref:FadR family transcriptional regulator n=1 Tax=Salinivibrio costicola TaxID=51367 RepID=A0ABX6K483_SALCS|nr:MULTISPECIES: GntR family transcriptional regulator [Salinivibrio]QCF35665.1 FadR family transcriptional regulator [Salinivibrio sp. YCSC6]QIR06352.1 FadR family transcriptional regulator [Salinivibrio costicola]
MMNITTQSLFHPVQMGRASEDVALQIESAILSEALKPGDKLPSERELQQQFGTGRGVVREAIQALKQKGLIEIRKGQKGGAVVRQVDVHHISESLALFLKQSHINAEKVAEFRETVDQSLVLLAMSRASKTQKVTLQETVEALAAEAASVSPDLDRLGELDRALNLLIAEMSGNPIFEWVMHALQQGFSSHDYALYQAAEYRRQTVENWQQTVHHIVAAEPFKAQATISHHYRLLQQCIDAQASSK